MTNNYENTTLLLKIDKNTALNSSISNPLVCSFKSIYISISVNIEEL